ncbi:MAG: hypothetical protein QOG01_1408, partial [Pseudonocardiales bacterium]|nr:hypothetical protein [Pseudonocardiales bacterium]
WAGWLITRHAHHHLIRIAGATYPVLTAFVVMATGNHYLLDVLAGAAVLALASVGVTSASRERPGPGLRRRPRGTSHRRRP